MSYVRLGGSLGKAMIASAVFMTAFSGTTQGMFGSFWGSSLDTPPSEQAEWSTNLSHLESLFSKQEYERLFTKLDYFLLAEQQKAFDWLETKAYEAHDVPCTYELIRRSLKSGNLAVWGTEILSDMLVLMILSLVQTKADVDCCTALSHKYKNPNYNPYDILRDNYHYRLKSRKLVQQFLYSEIIKKAKDTFEEIKNDTLPLPIWICTVDYGRTENWVYFGNPKSLDTECVERSYLRHSYALENMVNAVKMLREASFANIWAKLLTLSGWDEFFALSASGFKAISHQSSLECSSIIEQQTNDNNNDVNAKNDDITELNNPEAQDKKKEDSIEPNNYVEITQKIIDDIDKLTITENNQNNPDQNNITFGDIKGE